MRLVAARTDAVFWEKAALLCRNVSKDSFLCPAASPGNAPYMPRDEDAFSLLIQAAVTGIQRWGAFNKRHVLLAVTESGRPGSRRQHIHVW